MISFLKPMIGNGSERGPIAFRSGVVSGDIPHIVIMATPGVSTLATFLRPIFSHTSPVCASLLSGFQNIFSSTISCLASGVASFINV